MRMKVDLPAPFGPSKPNIPWPMSSDTPCSAVTGPGYTFTRLRIESIADLGMGLPSLGIGSGNDKLGMGPAGGGAGCRGQMLGAGGRWMRIGTVLPVGLRAR